MSAHSDPFLGVQAILAQGSGSLLEGAARLPKQLMGTESAVPAPEEAAVPASGSNILRVLKELGQSVAQARGKHCLCEPAVENPRRDRIFKNGFLRLAVLAV